MGLRLRRELSMTGKISLTEDNYEEAEEEEDNNDDNKV